MRIFPLLLAVVLAAPSLVPVAVANPVETVEATIRGLDQAEADAVLRGDFASVETFWAEDMTVNNPFNEVVLASRGPVRSGAITYTSFVRVVESVQVHGDTAITMGSETVVPSGKSPGAGTTIRRRYTNVWMQRGGAWRLAARHANVVCGN